MFETAWTSLRRDSKCLRALIGRYRIDGVLVNWDRQGGVNTTNHERRIKV